MSILKELVSASFKNAEFLIDLSTTTSGRKLVTHEFVNSDSRNVEDLGKLLKVFKVRGFINQPNYFQKRNRLIDALESGGKGDLSHPFYGTVQVIASPYTITEDMTKLGEANIEMEFQLADDVVLPQPVGANASQIATRVSAFNIGLALDVAGFDLDNLATGVGFNVSANNVFSFENARLLLDRVARAFDIVNEIFDTAVSVVNEFSQGIQNFKDNIVRLISNPANLANAIRGLFNQLNEIIVGTDVEQGVNIYREFFDFNSGSPFTNQSINVGNAISAELAETIRNDQLITRQMQSTSLSFGTLTASLTEFPSDQELDTTVDILQDQFRKLYDDTNTPTGSREALLDLRVVAVAFFEQEKLTINTTTLLTTKTIPAQVLGYTLYGNLDATDEIIRLNDDPNISFYEGEVRVLAG